MNLNTLSPALGHKFEKKRVGRGIGSGLGKTCGKGHKGQKARKSGNVRPGFEGGQMPLQKRLPKYGFTSRTSDKTKEIRTSELNKLDIAEISRETLIENGLITKEVKQVKIFLSGNIEKKFIVKGLNITAGAKLSIEKAGGEVVE